MQTPEEWRESGTTFQWREHSIFSRTAGTGEPLLVIHGFPTASWDFTQIWDRLTARHRALTLDMIGFGFSAKPRDFDYTIAAQADLYEAFLSHEGVGRHRILAHDYGNTVAQELLARRRGNIVSVCFLNGGLFPETHRALIGQKLLASPIGPLFARLSTFGIFASSMRKIWGAHPPSDAELRAMWQLVTRDSGQLLLPKLIGYMRERRVHRERWVGALGSGVPIRLVDGLLDPISGAHMVARLRELYPQSDVVELPRVGHYPQVEAPDATVEAVLDFTTRG